MRQHQRRSFSFKKWLLLLVLLGLLGGFWMFGSMKHPIVQETVVEDLHIDPIETH